MSSTRTWEMNPDRSKNSFPGDRKARHLGTAAMKKDFELLNSQVTFLTVPEPQQLKSLKS